MRMRTRLKKYLWLLRNARPSDLLQYACPWIMPVLTLPPAPLVLPEDPRPPHPLIPRSSKPFLLAKCSQVQSPAWLETQFEQAALNTTYLGRFAGYGHAAVRLYQLDPVHDPVEKWLWLRVLQHIAPDTWDTVDLWSIEAPWERLPSFKRAVRRTLGLRMYRVHYDGKRYTVTINPIHIPDIASLEVEWHILSTYLSRELP
ncbi:hypothetical protein GF339_13930 [candidate division KSB3 bacterium]|uniref:Uncharacterized protein n=1 Tax=candidate division KSB3 bacterium TaxID=2044937 RepID=A0A9D5Q6F1_9BACT|nr:hypothetical protein [candidate division KSB3 bacterium]MBD3325680.1 hypothetical protein [candidate division KSB3 bacterium]